MFDKKGVILLEGEIEEEPLLEASMEGGADNYEILEDSQGVEVYTEVTNLENLNQVLQSQDLPVKEVELRWIPNNMIEISDLEDMRSLVKLIDTLESLDDVQNVTANFDLSDELIDVNIS